MRSPNHDEGRPSGLCGEYKIIIELMHKFMRLYEKLFLSFAIKFY